MCRLYGFLSNEPTKVDCSLVFAQNALILQSRADEIGRHHADGWGIATYHDGIPRLIKNTTAAFNDQNFSAEAEKIYTTAAIAHVRKATVGTPNEFNTHPFRVGNWVFAHNGTVTAFEKVKQQLIKETFSDLQKHRHGETDSEQYFLWLLSQLRRNSLLDSSTDRFLGTSNDTRLRKHLWRIVEGLENLCQGAASDLVPKLNFLLTDGKTMVACRWNNSLHMVERHGLYECEICGIPHIHHHESVDHRALAFASEPITHETWKEVPNKSFVISSLDVEPATAS